MAAATQGLSRPPRGCLIVAASAAACALLYLLLRGRLAVGRRGRGAAKGWSRTVVADAAVACLCAAALAYALTAACRGRGPGPAEHFATATTTTTTTSSAAATTSAASTSLDKILSIIGIQNGVSQDVQATASSIAQLSADYNENLQPISASLTLYYSAFSASSYPKNGRTWYNIAPFFSTPASTCPDVRLEDTHIQFSQTVSFSRENGFGIGSTTLTGPRAFQMGLAGNSSFTLFACINFTAFNTNQADPTRPYDLLRLPANTRNNNGLSISFAPQVSQVTGGQYVTKITVAFGSQSVQATDPASPSSTAIVINPAYTYLLVLVKNNLDVSLVLYPNIDNIGSAPSGAVRIVRGWRVDPREEVLFSNKEMTMNANGNIYANLYSFGAYNTALDDSRLGMLYLHTQAELHKTNQLLQNLAQQIGALQAQVDAAKQCPYTAQVCDACPSVKDWTNATNLIAAGDDKCLSGIDAYCTANPRADMCACWNPSNALSRTNECKNYVNIFRKAAPAAAIDAATLQQIKAANNLCPCAAPGADAGGTGAAVLPKRAPFVLAVDGRYSVNDDDLQAYEAMDVVQFYDGAPAPAPVGTGK